MRRLLPLLALLLCAPTAWADIAVQNGTGCAIIGPVILPQTADTQLRNETLDHNEATLEVHFMGNAYTAPISFTVAGTDAIIDVTTTGTCQNNTSTDIGWDLITEGFVEIHVPDTVTGVSGNTQLQMLITDGKTNIPDMWFDIDQSRSSDIAIAEAVRDVSNSSPAAGSLGEDAANGAPTWLQTWAACAFTISGTEPHISVSSCTP